MSVLVMGGVDELKFLEKQRLSKVALEAGEETEEPSLSISVGMDLAPSVRLLIAFQKSLREGLRALKNSFFDLLSARVTAFLSFLYCEIREGYTLDLLKRAFLFLISWIILLDNHGRFLLLGSEALGMHLCMTSRKALHQLFQEVLGSPSTSMPEGSRLERSSSARVKFACLYRQIFLEAWGATLRVSRDTTEKMPLWSDVPSGVFL